MNTARAGLPGGPISHAIARLARIHQLLAGRLLRDLGLHPSQELLLMRLWESGPQRQTDLAAELGTDSASTTRIVQRLEAAGYVRRLPDPVDRRATWWRPPRRATPCATASSASGNAWRS